MLNPLSIEAYNDDLAWLNSSMLGSFPRSNKEDRAGLMNPGSMPYAFRNNDIGSGCG